MRKHIGQKAFRDDSGAVVFDNSDKYREIKNRRFQHQKMETLESRVTALARDMGDIKKLLQQLVDKD